MVAEAGVDIVNSDADFQTHVDPEPNSANTAVGNSVPNEQGAVTLASVALVNVTSTVFVLSLTTADSSAGGLQGTPTTMTFKLSVKSTKYGSKDVVVTVTTIVPV